MSDSHNDDPFSPPPQAPAPEPVPHLGETPVEAFAPPAEAYAAPAEAYAPRSTSSTAVEVHTAGRAYRRPGHGSG